MISKILIRGIWFLRNHHAILCVLLLLVAGCQPKVYLMPPPVGLQPDSKLFDLVEDDKDENLLYTLFATNRTPVQRFNGLEGYTIYPSDSVRLGFVVHSVGDEGMNWDDLHRLSISDKRDNDLVIKQVYVREMVEYDEDDDLEKMSSRAEGFFDQINALLDKRLNTNDLLVYVHGANSNFYRATAQGAQTFHFTGHNSLLLTFSWPSAENILKYTTDVLHAGQSASAFGRLIEILANHTNARKINILSYSIGAQVTVPGLVYLRDKYPYLSDQELKERLRIGEVYFAAPDIAFDSFVNDFIKFKEIVDRTSINLNQSDRVLQLSAFKNGISRLGKPDPKDITLEHQQIMIEASKTSKLDILNVSSSEGLHVGAAHDSWYTHPWVSNDMLLLAAFNTSPIDRGLERTTLESGLEIYYFPKDYDLKIRDIIDSSQNQFFEEREKVKEMGK